MASLSTSLILLADDELNFRGNLQEVLELEGYQVMAVLNAASALDFLHRSPTHPSLVITDREMGAMDGLEFAQALYASPRWNPIPVMVVSASADPRLREPASLPLNIKAVLAKPCTLSDILESIRQVIE